MASKKEKKNIDVELCWPKSCWTNSWVACDLWHATSLWWSGSSDQGKHIEHDVVTWEVLSALLALFVEIHWFGWIPHTKSPWCGALMAGIWGDLTHVMSLKWNGSLKIEDIFSTLRTRQNGHHFPDDIFRCIFSNENVWISIKISLKFVPNGHGPINNIPALVQIMAWHRTGDKPLFETMMTSLPTHICVTRSQC